MNSEELQKLKLEEEIARDLIHRYPTTVISFTPKGYIDWVSASSQYLKNANINNDKRVLLRRRRG